MTRPGRYPQELRERAVRMVFEHQSEHESQWAAICSIANPRPSMTRSLGGAASGRLSGGTLKTRPQAGHSSVHSVIGPSIVPRSRSVCVQGVSTEAIFAALSRSLQSRPGRGNPPLPAYSVVSEGGVEPPPPVKGTRPST
jgi:hypothetical protein